MSFRESQRRYMSKYKQVECPKCHGRGVYRYPVPINFVIRTGEQRDYPAPEVYETTCPTCRGERYCWEKA